MLSSPATRACARVTSSLTTTFVPLRRSTRAPGYHRGAQVLASTDPDFDPSSYNADPSVPAHQLAPDFFL